MDIVERERDEYERLSKRQTEKENFKPDPLDSKENKNVILAQ
jgi:hypothetical protein